MRAWEHARSLLPQAADYREATKSWRMDVTAGLTVGIVALPLALGFGISSGAGAEAGIVTAIIAGIVAAIFGGSHVQVSGPTGAMVVVLAPIIAAHGVGALALVSLMAGVIVLVAGALRMGRAVSLIPWPVIEGFTLGIAVIIFLQQIPTLTSAEPSTGFSDNVAVAAAQSLASVDARYLVWTLVCVVIVAACMVLLPRIHGGIPASLVGIVVATAVSHLSASGLATIGELPSTLPAPSLPHVDLHLAGSLLMPAVMVAALAGIESLLAVRVAATMSDIGRYDPDRELIGQGLASIGAGLFGGMPATGAIARTAVSLRAGARTRIAAITHALVLLVVILFVSGPIGQVPLAALAGVLMVTAIRMVDRRTTTAILRSTRAGAAAFVVTAIVTVSVDLVVAVIIGMLVAGFFALRSMSRITAIHREEIPGNPQPGDERISLIRIRGPLFFPSADRVTDEATNQRDVSVVILQMSQLTLVDATGARALEAIVTQLERRNVTVLIKGIAPGHALLFQRIGVVGALRHANHLFTDLTTALEHARSHIERERLPAPDRKPEFRASEHQ